MSRYKTMLQNRPLTSSGPIWEISSIFLATGSGQGTQGLKLANFRYSSMGTSLPSLSLATNVGEASISSFTCADGVFTSFVVLEPELTNVSLPSWAEADKREGGGRLRRVARIAKVLLCCCSGCWEDTRRCSVVKTSAQKFFFTKVRCSIESMFLQQCWVHTVENDLVGWKMGFGRYDDGRL